MTASPDHPAFQVVSVLVSFCIISIISSPLLKAKVSFFDHLSSVRLSVCKLFTFSVYSPEPLHGPMSTKLGARHAWVVYTVSNLEGIGRGVPGWGERDSSWSNDGSHHSPRVGG